MGKTGNAGDDNSIEHIICALCRWWEQNQMSVYGVCCNWKSEHDGKVMARDDMCAWWEA